MAAFVAMAALAGGAPVAQAQDTCIPVFILNVCPVDEALYTVDRARQEVEAAGDVEAILDSKVTCGAERAACARSGDDDLPRDGFTDDITYNCGLINGREDVCFAPGKRNPDNAQVHDWGWGSADYDGRGSLVVCVHSSQGSMSDCRDRLARACYYASCNDQDIEGVIIGVGHKHDHNHTIYGHAKA